MLIYIYFQINNRYWCKDSGIGGGCNINCAGKAKTLVPGHSRHVISLLSMANFSYIPLPRMICTSCQIAQILL